MAKPPPRPMKKKACVFCREEVAHIDWDLNLLRKYISRIAARSAPAE